MVFLRWNGAGVFIGIGAIRIIRLVKVQYQLIARRDAQVNEPATSIGFIPIGQVFERKEQVVLIGVLLTEF
jgi:hypothetical protein